MFSFSALGRTCRRGVITLLLAAAFLVPAGRPPQQSPHLMVAQGHLSPGDLEMVDLQTVIPDLEVELRYAGGDNICGEPIYPFRRAYLRSGTAHKLREAQEEFQRCGYRLKIWDAYRPPQAQFDLWQEYPDPRFIINPHAGYSYHSKGVAVDVTLVDARGREVRMPSEFDDFTDKANRDYEDVETDAAVHAELLQVIMQEHGFDSIYYEWWHFVDHDRAFYDVVDLNRLPDLAGEGSR